MSLPDHDTQAAIALACSELVDMLDALYPEKSPEGHEEERTLWMRAGERRLVRRLLELKKNAKPRRA